MFISEKWLKEIIDLQTISGQDIASKMSTTGIEIESVTNYGKRLKKLVVGKTLEVIDHPDSDHLHVCQVDVGVENAPDSNGVLQIVCGAPNVSANQKVIVALPGARITDNIKIKKGKIRGVVSNGMLCSLEELGLPSNVIPKEMSDGIYILPEDTVVGSDIVDLLQLDDDILELSITPNRSDALSMYGTAYEVGAIYNKKPHFESYEQVVATNDTIDHYVSTITIDDDTKSKAYFMSVIKNVTIKPSPLWLQTRLMKIGVRPVNNVVDVTNYMLMQYGQPLHAFDYDKLQDKNIRVRLAHQGEKLQTLDEKEQVLVNDDVVISAGQTAVGLAGVMGGLNSEITNNTSTVALEVALFDAKRVRQTSKRLNLRSESSVRFEKGIHEHLMQEVIQKASALIATLGEGTVVSGVKSIDNRQMKNSVVPITLQKINRSLGTQLTHADCYHILVERLAFSMSLKSDGTNVVQNASALETAKESEFYVIIPPRRFDISIPSDIVEEVARIYGYDNLPNTLPTTASISGGLSATQRFLRHTKRLLQSLGYSQTIGYSLTSQEKAGLLSLYDNNGIQLAMPMSEERSYLRRSLVTTLLDTARYNVARQNTDLALYETGRVFLASDKSKQGFEIEHVALLLTGKRQDKSWLDTAQMVDFFDIKGTLDAYFNKLGLTSRITYQASQKEQLHPGQTANILLDDTIIGFVAQIHPTLASAYDLGKVFVAEFEVSPLVNCQKGELVQQTVPKYPNMTRDIALLVDKTVSHDTIQHIIKANGGKYLQHIALFDYYVGENIGENKKSLAYRLTFLNLEATLVEEDVNTAVSTIVTQLEQSIQAVVR